MLTFTLAILFDHIQFALIHGPDSPGSYAILLFTALDLASITSHIHHWVLFCFGSIPSFFLELFLHWSPVACWGTYWPGEFFFQYPIILSFHTVHGVLKARILKWFAIPFSSGPHSVRLLHHDPPVLGNDFKIKGLNLDKIELPTFFFCILITSFDIWKMWGKR